MTNYEKYKTAKERSEAFWRHYKGYIHGAVEAFSEWLDQEAPEEKPLPCPFCGEGVSLSTGGCDWSDERQSNHYATLSCHCGYRSPIMNTKEEVVRAHNDFCKLVKDGVKK